MRTRAGENEETVRHFRKMEELNIRSSESPFFSGRSNQMEKRFLTLEDGTPAEKSMEDYCFVHGKF